MLLNILLFSTLFSGHFLQAKNQIIARPPAVAGSFYPSDPLKLKAMLNSFLQQCATKKIKGHVYGVIAPHAGYVYSGQVAAYAYSILQERKLKRAVILSPSHFVSFSGTAIYDGDFYETPLGQIPVDKEFGHKLAAYHDLLELSDTGHTVYPGQRSEHALEVQIPFLQTVASGVRIVPIVMGDQSYETCRTLGEALASHIEDEHTIIIASSDLSHYHAYDEAIQMDRKLLNAIEEWDYYNINRNCATRHWEACGAGPIVATMIAAEKLGANTARILHYANSGDVPHGDKQNVVGYAAIALCEEPQGARSNTHHFSLNQNEQEYLLSIARHTIETAVGEGILYECSSGGHENLAKERGAFVTIRKNGDLRGCIGFTSPLQPLCLAVRDAALNAAFKDPRFSPVSGQELSQLDYEISVLSPLRRISDPDDISIGQHGIIIRRGKREGLLLPQVAVQYQWDVNTFLRQTCRKAGLPSDAWQDDETDIFIFSAQVFGDDK